MELITKERDRLLQRTSRLVGLSGTAVSLACLFRRRAELSRTAGVDKSFPGFFEQLRRLKAGIA